MSPTSDIWHPFTQEALDPPPIRIVRAEGVYLLHRRRAQTDRRNFVLVGEPPRPRPSGNHRRHCASRPRKSITSCSPGLRTMPSRNCAAACRKFLPPKSGTHFLLRRWLNSRGSRAENGRPVLAEHRTAGKAHDRRARACVSRRHGRRDVGRRATRLSAIRFVELCSPCIAFIRRIAIAARWEECASHAGLIAPTQLAQLLAEKGGEIAAVIVEPLLQGAGGMIVHPVEFLQRVRQAVQRARRTADRGRSADGLWPLRENVRVRAGERRAGHDVPFKGADGRSPADGRHRLHGRDPRSRSSAQIARALFITAIPTPGIPLPRQPARRACEFLRTSRCSIASTPSRAFMASGWQAIQNHPAVGEVRSIGTMAAIELRADDAGYFSKLRPKLYKFFLDAGVLLRPLGNVVYVLPPYAITPAELQLRARPNRGIARPLLGIMPRGESLTQPDVQR